MDQNESIGKWISALYRYMQIYINKEFEQYHIGSGQYHVLLVLSKNIGINQEAISKILHLDKATIGRAIKKLEKEGYVKRVTDPHDHRAYILNVTNEGKQIIPKIKRSLSQLSTQLMTDFSFNEKESALKLLKKMYRNMTIQNP